MWFSLVGLGPLRKPLRDTSLLYYGKILRGEPKEQYLSTVPKSCSKNICGMFELEGVKLEFYTVSLL